MTLAQTAEYLGLRFPCLTQQKSLSDQKDTPQPILEGPLKSDLL